MLAARRSVVTVEEVVDALDARPGAVVLPSWVVTAVAEVPGGAAPSYAHGYSVRDNAAYAAWDAISRDRDTFLAWMQDSTCSTSCRAGVTDERGTHGRRHPDHDRRAAQERGDRVPEGVRQAAARRRPAAASSTCSPTTRRSTSRSGAWRPARTRSAGCSATWAATLKRHRAPLLRVQLGLLGIGRRRVRGHEPRRAPRRPVAGRRARVGGRALVRRVRDPRLPDPAGLHLPRPRLRGEGHRSATRGWRGRRAG